MTAPSQTVAASASRAAERTTFAILIAISLSHTLNDMIQSLILASYPMLKEAHHLDFTQIGLITLTFQITASALQPVVGLVADRRPMPFSLAAGMGFTLTGLLLLSSAGSFHALLAAVALIGVGSSVFHPECSRVARLASGGRPGLAQSLFQVGGNSGQALGPLMALLVVQPYGQSSLAWFSAAALAGMLILAWVGTWHRRQRRAARTAPARTPDAARAPGPVVARALIVLVALMFSKFFYLASLTSYFTFYLMKTFELSIREAQFQLFILLAAAAAGTLAGGPLGDRFGRKPVIWLSILGVLPFTLALPYADLFWTTVLAAVIGFILSSAFPAIVVYGQELLPGKVGAISGLFFGGAFALAGVGAAALGALADRTSIGYVYHLCSFLPAIGLLAWFLPDMRRGRSG